MFGNFLQETCTGTNGNLALLGATIENIKFSKRFVDGDLVKYIVADADGVKKCSGVGTYELATDSILRPAATDTFTWDGTTYDDNPGANITLTAGTHTISCDVTSRSLSITPQQPKKWQMNSNGYDSPDNWFGSVKTNATHVVNRCTYLGISLHRSRVVTSIGISVLTADAAATKSKVGFYSVGIDSKPSLLLASVSIDVTTTGIKQATLASPLSLPAGDYFTAFVTDGAPVIVSGTSGSFSATSYMNSFNIPRNYHPAENLAGGWTDLPATPNPTLFTENSPAIVVWR